MFRLSVSDLLAVISAYQVTIYVPQDLLFCIIKVMCHGNLVAVPKDSELFAGGTVHVSICKDTFLLATEQCSVYLGTVNHV